MWSEIFDVRIRCDKKTTPSRRIKPINIILRYKVENKLEVSFSLIKDTKNVLVIMKNDKETIQCSSEEFYEFLKFLEDVYYKNVNSDLQKKYGDLNFDYWLDDGVKNVMVARNNVRLWIQKDVMEKLQLETLQRMLREICNNDIKM